jgi:hypothetical protein
MALDGSSISRRSSMALDGSGISRRRNRELSLDETAPFGVLAIDLLQQT